MIAALSATTTRQQAVTRLTEAFHASGVEDPAREARLVLCAACDLTQVEIIAGPDRPLHDSAAALRAVAARRTAREPLSRILGQREFWGLRFAITPDVLDPRPDTETVVEAALAALADRRDEPLRILDLGVGSGVLLAALLSEFGHARGVGIDVSPEAAQVAERNLSAHGLGERGAIRVGSWTTPLDAQERFDLIVSNPPYIRTAEIDMLAPEVRDHDARLALDGGSDGLDAYRALLPAAARSFLPGGWLMVEIGIGQAEDVAALAARSGLAAGGVRHDLAGVERVVTASAPGG